MVNYLKTLFSQLICELDNPCMLKKIIEAHNKA